jgi:hypothetical protein
MIKIFLTIILWALTIIAFTQVIPSDRLVNWNNAGYTGEIPDPENIIDVTTYGAVGDSSTDNYTAVSEAIASLEGRRGVILFPEGDFLIRGTVNLPDSVIIRGISPELTEIIFNNEGETASCFVIASLTAV